MGGFNEPAGQTSDILQGGWDVGFGVAFRQPGSPLALRLEMNYAQNNATNQLINQGTAQSGLQINSGWADLFSVTANAELRFPFAQGSYAYIIAGGGGYYTQISLTTQGYGYVCDPWFGYLLPRLRGRRGVAERCHQVRLERRCRDVVCAAQRHDAVLRGALQRDSDDAEVRVRADHGRPEVLARAGAQLPRALASGAGARERHTPSAA